MCINRCCQHNLLQVFNLKRECKNHLWTILQLTQENQYLKAQRNHAESPSPCTLLRNEESKSRSKCQAVSVREGVVTCGQDQSLVESCGGGESESYMNGVTATTLQENVYKSKKEEQPQQHIYLSSDGHHKEDFQQVELHPMLYTSVCV